MKNITYKNDTYQIPFNITCTVSGVTKVYTSEEYINKKLDQHGGLDKFRSAYICKAARKGIKKVATPVETPVVPDAPAIPTDIPVEDNRPIAKMDKRGQLRNAKGHPIKKGTEDQYRIAA